MAKKTTKKPAKKPAPKKMDAPPRELTRAEAFYVENHISRQSEERIASDLGVPVESVAAYMKVLRDSNWTPPGGDNGKVGQAGFATKGGSVAMTPHASEEGDVFRKEGSKKKGRNEEFFRRRAPGIHVIDPSRPVF